MTFELLLSTDHWMTFRNSQFIVTKTLSNLYVITVFVAPATAALVTVLTERMVHCPLDERTLSIFIRSINSLFFFPEVINAAAPSVANPFARINCHSQIRLTFHISPELLHALVYYYQVCSSWPKNAFGSNRKYRIQLLSSQAANDEITKVERLTHSFLKFGRKLFGLSGCQCLSVQS